MTIRPMNNLDGMAPEYIQRLVASLKHEGELTSPLVEEASTVSLAMPLSITSISAMEQAAF